MPSYVERDGDWVLRPPGALDDTDMFIAVLPVADSAAIQSLCDEMINTPSGGAVSASPSAIMPNHVLMVNADIQNAHSNHVDDSQNGSMTERDVGFFVPVDFRDAAGNTSLAMLLPYLFVDNLPALLIGREIFGFPKLLGKIDIALQPQPLVTLESPVTQIVGGSPVVSEQTVASLATLDPGQLQFCAPGFAIDVTLALLQIIAAALGASAPTAGFTSIPMVFLKQFRDVATDGQACHQSVTRGVGSIDAIRSLCVHLLADFQVTLPAYESIHIAQTLGLGPGPTFQSRFAVSADLDFSLDWGTAEWTAP